MKGPWQSMIGYVQNRQWHQSIDLGYCHLSFFSAIQMLDHSNASLNILKMLFTETKIKNSISSLYDKIKDFNIYFHDDESDTFRRLAVCFRR